MTASNRYADGSPADTQAMVYERTPIGDMTNDELYRGIYRPAMATMPACSGDCQQMGGEHCPHPQDCQLKGGGGWLVASFAFGAVFLGALWAYFTYWG